MKIAVILNRQAGTLAGLPFDEAAAAIRAPFQAQGAEVTVEGTDGPGCSARVEEAARSDADVVVVGGGDGTIATAVNIVLPTGKAMGFLPLGTMNLLTRDLNTPLDPAEAAAALAAGTLGAIDVGEVNGEVFLTASVLGLYPTVVQERERQRSRLGLRKWPAMALAIAKGLYRLPIVDARLDLGTEHGEKLGAVRVRTPILAVSNNPYAHGFGPVVRRTVLDSGKLGVYVAHHQDAWGMMRLMGRMMLGTWQQDQELDAFHSTGLTVHSRRRHLRVANDGEVRKLVPPLVYRIRPGALRVLMPPAPAPEAETGAGTTVAGPS